MRAWRGSVVPAGTSIGVAPGTAVGVAPGTAVGGAAGTAVEVAAGTSIGVAAGTAVGGAAGTAVGVAPGAAVGVAPGAAVEVAAGTAIGVAPGAAVGVAAGTAIGVAPGTAVGVAAGTSTGVAAGTAVGGAPGTAVGVAPGTAVGVAPGTSIGVAAGTAVGGAPGTAVGVAPGTAVGVAPGTSIGVAAGTAVGDAAGTAVGVAPGTAVGVAPGTAVGVAAGTSIGVAAGTAIGVAPGAAVGVAPGTAVALAAAFTVALIGVAACPAGAFAAPPAKPSGPSPAHGATGVGVTAAPELCVDVADPDGGTVTVSFLGRRVGPPGEDFTVVVLPDPQFYAKTYPDLYRAQTEWIAANRDALRIAFVTGVGDMTDDGDLDGQQYQWKNAHDAFAVLEAATSDAYPDGIPYGMCLGNHDNGFAARFGGDEGATTIQYTRKFGLTRWCGGSCAGDPSRACRSDVDCAPPAACAGPVGACRSYFGGRFDFGDPAKYPLNTDNNFGLFRGGGIDFAIFHLEYDTSTGPESAAPLDWMADTAANAHPDRQAIVVSHWLMASAGNPPAWSSQGQSIWNRVKALPNVFLMLCGHLTQASRRTDAADDGHAVHTLLSDYQYAPYGGRGWLRVMTFSPKAGVIRVRTISPWVNYPDTPRREGTIVGHADNTAGAAQNEFEVGWAAGGSGSFATIATLPGVAAGSRACVPWPAAVGGWAHEWIVKVGDGDRTTAGPRWSFGTACTVSPECDDADPCTSDACEAGACVRTPVAACCRADADCDDGDDCTTDGCTAHACASTRVPGCCRTDRDCEGFGCVAGPCIPTNLGALDLPGGGAYADAGTGAALNDHGNGSFTVEGWFLAETAASPYGGLFGQGRQGNASHVQVQLPTSAPYNRLHVLVEAETPSYIITQVDATPIPFGVGTWHHFAAVVDRTAGAQRLRVFLDGVLADEKVASIWGSWPIRSVDSTLIGATRAPWGDPTYFFDGRLDEVRVWDRALGAEEIAAGMRAPIASAPGLVARWSMDEGAGGVAADSAGTSDATLVGGAGWVAQGATGGFADLGAGECDWTLLDGPACDDGNACTLGDACANGACKPGVFMDCNDLDPCTVGDTCVDGMCVAGTPTVCDDLDPCTLGDACVNGLCVPGAPMVCDDGDPCTVGDACVAGECVPGAPMVCDDGDPCTTGDACAAGECVPGAPMVCDDGDPCTVDDACVAGECVPGAPMVCDDGDPCTVGDACADGACVPGTTVPGCCPVGTACDLPHPPDPPMEDAATPAPDSPPDEPPDAPADAAPDMPSTPDEALVAEDSATADQVFATP
ncbi:MAG: metallophosphoesterase, partial [Deltaproteobacteria bacterium]|nr:metallophosphoesterase [Deltaproteobacteria bacterium]